MNLAIKSRAAQLSDETTHRVRRSPASIRKGTVRTYWVNGEIFIATAEAFHSASDFREEDLERVIIDVHASYFRDINALDRVVLKFHHHDIPVEIVGLNEASATLVDRLGTYDKEGARLASGH